MDDAIVRLRSLIAVTIVPLVTPQVLVGVMNGHDLWNLAPIVDNPGVSATSRGWIVHERVNATRIDECRVSSIDGTPNRSDCVINDMRRRDELVVVGVVRLDEGGLPDDS